MIALGESLGDRVAICDVSQMKITQHIQTDLKGAIEVATVSKDGTRFAIGFSDGRLAMIVLSNDWLGEKHNHLLANSFGVPLQRV